MKLSGEYWKIDLGLRHRARRARGSARRRRRRCRRCRLVEPEDDPALQGRGRVVEVHDGAPGAADRFEGALDQFGRAPGSAPGSSRRRGSSSSSISSRTKSKSVSEAAGNPTSISLKPSFTSSVEHPALALGTHRLDQRLVAVAQVDAAPDRRLVDDLRRPAAGRAGRSGANGRYLWIGMLASETPGVGRRLSASRVLAAMDTRSLQVRPAGSTAPAGGKSPTQMTDAEAPMSARNRNHGNHHLRKCPMRGARTSEPAPVRALGW